MRRRLHVALIFAAIVGAILSITLPSFAQHAIVEFHVCRRPPNVPSGWGRWSYTGSSTIPSIETSDKKVFDKKTEGMAVFVFDPWAPQSSMNVLPIPHNTLRCGPPPPKPPPPANPPKSKAAAPPGPVVKGNGPGKSGDKPKDEKPALPAIAAESPQKEAPKEKVATAPATGNGIKKLPPGTIIPIEKNPSGQQASNLPPDTSPLPPSTALLPKGDAVGTGAQKLNQGKSNELADLDPTRGGGPGQAGHAPLTGLEKMAYELAFAAAIVNGQMNEDLAKPGSSAHGIVGGQNPNGPDSAIVQAAVSFTQICSGVAVTQAAKFVQRLKKAFVVPEKIVLNGVDDLGEEAAEALAKQYGIEIADALMKNGTIGPYSVMKKFTAKMGGAYQAHHIYEQAKIKQFMKGADPDKFPAVILTKEKHQEITKRLAEKTTEGIHNPAQQWAAYKEVYKDYPDWLEAIRPYFEKK